MSTLSVSLATISKSSIAAVDLSTCGQCAKTAKKILLCSRCKKIAYCDSKCQKLHWPTHKEVCRLPVQEPMEKKSDEPGTSGGEQSELVSQLKQIKSSYRHVLFLNIRAYITSNEKGQSAAISALSKIQAVGDVFIGIGGLSCLNLAAVRPRISHVIIIDVSPYIVKLWNAVGPIIAQSKNKEECLARISDHLEKSIADYGPSQSYGALILLLPRFIDVLSARDCWLMDAQKYDRIMGIFARGNFTCLQLDVTDADACKKIGAVFQKSHLKVDTFYLSNVHDFISPDRVLSFGKSLNSLLAEDSIIVDTHEHPFKITKSVSNSHFNSHLRDVVGLSADKQKPDGYTQRVRQRDKKAIGELFPLVKVAALCKDLGEFYYLYGLENKYYTEAEATQISDSMDALLESAPKHQLEKYQRAALNAVVNKRPYPECLRDLGIY